MKLFFYLFLINVFFKFQPNFAVEEERKFFESFSNNDPISSEIRNIGGSNNFVVCKGERKCPENQSLTEEECKIFLSSITYGFTMKKRVESTKFPSGCSCNEKARQCVFNTHEKGDKEPPTYQLVCIKSCQNFFPISYENSYFLNLKASVNKLKGAFPDVEDYLNPKEKGQWKGEESQISDASCVEGEGTFGCVLIIDENHFAMKNIN